MPDDILKSFSNGGGFDAWNLFAGFVFGVIGYGVLTYGRNLRRWKPISIGLALMIYPYFVYNRWALWGIGIGLLVLLGFQHDE